MFVFLRGLFKVFNIITIFLFTTTCAFINYGSYEEKLDYYFSYYANKNLFSGSSLVAKNGKIIFNKGYNIARSKGNIPFTKNTQTSIMSLSKQFAGCSIMILVDRGLMKTDDLVSKYMPGLPDQGTLKIHHLLCMRSGIYNYLNVLHQKAYEGNLSGAVTYDEILNKLKTTPHDYSPDEKYYYNNTNYYLLAKIVEIVSGVKFSEFLNLNIFTPAGMNKTFQAETKSDYGVLPDYFETSIIGNFHTKDMPDPSIIFGCGGIISTTEDLFKFNKYLHSGSLLSKSSYEKLITPFSNANKEGSGYIFKTNYCYGIIADDEITINGKKRKTLWHSGSFSNGVSTFMVHFINENIDIVILENIRIYPALEQHVIDSASIILK
jgi:CubicO group peptidase (beta-lactamase class C family)